MEGGPEPDEAGGKDQDIDGLGAAPRGQRPTGMSEGCPRHHRDDHGRDGTGVTADIPNFGRGEGLWSSDSQLVLRIEGGKNGCPPFLGMLDRQGIFDVISYLRTFQ